MKKLLLLLLSVSFFSVNAKDVKIDCTMISSDVAIFLQKVMREVKRSKPPANACGVSMSIKVGHIDDNLKSENYKSDDMGITPIDFRNHFDFYFNEMKEHLTKSFKIKNMANQPKEIKLKNIYRFQAGAEHREVAPSATEVIAHNFHKKTYQSPKENWGVEEPRDKDLEESERCNFSIFADIVWVLSKPLNDVSGFVNKIDKNGKKEKLNKGKVRFKREGPNNGKKTVFEKEIKEGYYHTKPELPSGHYKVELVEPKECQTVIDNNWIFKSGLLNTKSFDVKCEENHFFTVTTSKKTTKILKPIEHYRGINKDLKSYEEDKDTYYIYVDVDNARIVQLHIDSKSTRKIHREAYKLNTESCQYEVKKKDKLIKNMGGSPVLESEDAGWGFEDDTKFYVNLTSSDKELSFTWGRLKKSGHYSKSIKYKEKIPKLAKEIIGKVNDMATEYRDGAKNSELIAFWKAGVDALASSKEEGCPAKVSFESMLIPPVDGMQDPDVEFKINIRLSTKSEIKILKNRMNIK